jgi:hypothetical protein
METIQKRGLSQQSRNALELLASSPPGVTEELLVYSRGFDGGMLAGIVHAVSQWCNEERSWPATLRSNSRARIAAAGRQGDG